MRKEGQQRLVAASELFSSMGKISVSSLALKLICSLCVRFTFV